MQSTRQAALIAAGGADLSGQEMQLYRRRRRGAHLTPDQHQWLDAFWPHQVAMLEDSARQLDRSDREVRRARRNGITVIDAGRVLAPIVSTGVTRPLARRRGAGRPRASTTRSSAKSGDSGDPDLGEPPASAPAEARGATVEVTS